MHRKAIILQSKKQEGIKLSKCLCNIQIRMTLLNNVRALSVRCSIKGFIANLCATSLTLI